MENSSVISLKNVRKAFGSTVVFENVNLEAPAGCITGISGPNGAGKSLLLRIITGLVWPSGGEVFVLGQQVGVDCEFAPRTGALIDAPGLLMDESGFRNLELLAGISGGADRGRIMEVLTIVGLDFQDRRPVRVWT